MSSVSRRIASISPSATLAVDAKAKALKASGVDVISFGAGEPDFPTPDAVVEAAIQACKDPVNYRYSSTSGLVEFRQAIVDKTRRDCGLGYDPSQVLVTNGAKQAIANTFATLLDPGDEVLVSSPYWTTYPESIALAGGVSVFIPTDETTNFQCSIEQLEKARTDRTKALLFVSPSNPTGSVYSKDSMEQIGKWALDNGIWVITDEIYGHLVYGQAKQHSIVSLVPGLEDQSVIINGVSKTYAMTGWRIGWMIGPKQVIQAATNLQSHETSNVANVSQRAAIAALGMDLESIEKIRNIFDQRRIKIYSMLSNIEGVSCVEPQGAFYIFPSMKNFLGKQIKGKVANTTSELCEIILNEIAVAVTPGEAFGTPGYIRFSYALGDEELVEGINRLTTLLA